MARVSGVPENLLFLLFFFEGWSFCSSLKVILHYSRGRLLVWWNLHGFGARQAEIPVKSRASQDTNQQGPVPPPYGDS